MATYLEIKQLLAEVFSIREIDETCDLILFEAPAPQNNVVLQNETLLQSYNQIETYSQDKLEMYTNKFREVALQTTGPISRTINIVETLIDSENGLTYKLGTASFEYCVFLLKIIADYQKEIGRRVLIDLRHRSQIVSRHLSYGRSANDPKELLSDVLRAYTLRIESEKDISLSRLRTYAMSLEFTFMYKQNMAVTEYTTVQDMIPLLSNGTRNRAQRSEVDAPPRRIYNKDVLDYYAMAMESRDPFTAYISYYHVVEHYFDAIYRRKLTEEIKNKLTQPGFSYKDENSLYDLAKYIRKHMSNDDNSGKGNEYDSLRYVLLEYAPIVDLKVRIDALDSTAVNYYQAEAVPFVKRSKSTKLAWTDSQGVYTYLTTRIYETRNALVHSKSEQAESQYRPYENKEDLLRELALIRAVAELVIINSSEIF